MVKRSGAVWVVAAKVKSFGSGEGVKNSREIRF